MSERTKALFDEALQLSESERAELAEALIESLDGPPSDIDLMTDEEFIKELDRRAEELRLHPERAVPWEVVKRIARSDIDP